MESAVLPSTHANSNSVVVKFLDVLISEVKRRPVLWDKKMKCDNYGIRRKMIEEWETIALKLNKSVYEVKTKWRNLKDTFHREEKRIQLPLVDEGKPITFYYTGQWDKFEKLLFLYNTRSHTRSKEEYIEANESEICIDNIKEEFDSSEHSNDNDPLIEEEEEQTISTLNEDTGSLDIVIDRHNTFPTEPLEIAINSGNDQNISVIHGMKRTLDDIDAISNKRRATEPLPIDIDIDEDMLVRTLVPFLRKLNPVRKLIVRNELQNLLLKELLCDQCRTNGLQPKCRCNYN